MPSTHTEMASSRKRQEDKNLKILRELVTQPHNKKCFDCGQRGPTYVNMTIGAFVCTSCSGLLRGLNPPHRIKSISMASFNQQEIEFLQKHGNQVCHYTWLALRNTPVENESREEQKMKDYLVYKYERKVWYSDQKPPPSVVSQPAEEQPPAAKPLKSLLGTSVNVFVSTEAPAQKPQTIISTAGLSTSSSFEAPKPRANNNMDLLSSNFASDPFASTAAPNNVIDPFAQASAQQSTPPLFDAFTSSDDSRNQDSFDLFVNAKPNASQSTTNNQANGAATPAMPIGNSNGSVDKYAALAELDMSNTQSVFSSSSIFGSSPATNNNSSVAQPAAPSAQPNPFMSPSVSSSGAAVFQQQQQKPVNPFMSAAPAAAAPSTNIFGSAAPAADTVPQTNNIFGNARWDMSNTSSSSSLDFNNVPAASNTNASYFPFGQSPATAAAATNNFMSMSTAAPTAAVSQHANMFSSQSSSPFQNNMGFSTGQPANQKAFPQQVRPQQPQQQNQFQNQFQNQQPFSTQPQQQQPQHPFGNPTQPFGNPTQPFGNPSQPFGNQTQPFGNPSQPFGNQFAQQPQQPFSSHQAQPFSSQPQQQQQQQQYNFSMDPNSSQSSQMFNSNFNSPFGSASTNQNQASSVFGAPANSTPFNQPVKSTNPFM